MRYLKVLAIVVFFFVSMVFFVQNTTILSTNLNLRFDLFSFHWLSPDIPIYIFILLAFVIGALLAMVYFLFEKMRQTRELRRARAQIKSLEDELDSLRPTPADTDTEYSDQEEEEE